jgi:ribosomal protein S27E
MAWKKYEVEDKSKPVAIVDIPAPSDPTIIPLDGFPQPWRPAHCRRCGDTQPTYLDVCNGQTEVHCGACHQVLQRLGTEKKVVGDAVRGLYPSQRVQ